MIAIIFAACSSSRSTFDRMGKEKILLERICDRYNFQFGAYEADAVCMLRSEFSPLRDVVWVDFRYDEGLRLESIEITAMVRYPAFEPHDLVVAVAGAYLLFGEGQAFVMDPFRVGIHSQVGFGGFHVSSKFDEEELNGTSWGRLSIAVAPGHVGTESR